LAHGATKNKLLTTTNSNNHGARAHSYTYTRAHMFI